MLGSSFLYALSMLLDLQGGATASAQSDPGRALQSLAATEPEDAVRAMEEVFAGSEFWWKRTEQVENPRLPWAWLGDMITTFFKALWNVIEPVLEGIYNFVREIWYGLRQVLGLPLGLGDFHTGSLVLSVLLLALFGWLLWKVQPLLWQWLKSGETPRRGPRAEADIQEALPEARVLLDQAIQAHQAARYREALRFAFLALLAFLQHRGSLRYDPSRTNREYLHDLRESPHLSVIFRETARPYERAWYGQLPVNSEQATQVLGMCRQLVMQEEAAR